jgi:O-antigen ligase
MKSETNAGRAEFYYALAFGFFLGLTIWKFGNPVILDTKVSAPTSLTDFWSDAWPPHWANWFLIPFAVVGILLGLRKGLNWQTNQWPGWYFRARRSLAPPQGRSNNRWLWWLPLVWLGWQFFSALYTVDADLTTATLWQFSGCLAAYFAGWWLFAEKQALNRLLIGILLAFTYCLVQADLQKNYEFPESRQMLMEGERSGWTNFPPATVADMKRESIIITTNGLDVANPAILAKFTKGRVNGTLVYPNALAGLILLLFPVSLVIAFKSTGNLKRPIRWAAILMALFLGGAAFFWTGSKLGWLLGIGVIGLFLLRLDWSAKVKFAAVTAVLVLGMGIFAVRFHNYFSAGATSVSARFDYWRAAVQTTAQNPLFGSGPGTFQRPYQRLKSPEAEMARLTHNDYLEQFSDSGVAGGLAYAAWIGMALWVIARKVWRDGEDFLFALFAGLSAWFAQGLGEFSLYIPALAWTAFTLLGSLVGMRIIEIDKKPPIGYNAKK